MKRTILIALIVGVVTGGLVGFVVQRMERSSSAFLLYGMLIGEVNVREAAVSQAMLSPDAGVAIWALYDFLDTLDRCEVPLSGLSPNAISTFPFRRGVAHARLFKLQAGLGREAEAEIHKKEAMKLLSLQEEADLVNFLEQFEQSGSSQ